jgi:uncharacterized protein YndB with AHSA1/START domain
MMETIAGTRSVVKEQEFAHSQAKVWRALTDGELISRWLLQNDFQPVVGHRFRLQSTPMPPHWDGVIECQVLVVEPITALTYSWSAMGLDSLVAWTLTPTSTGTLVRMEHSGFREDQEHAYKGAGYGWQKFLGQLVRLVGEMDVDKNKEAV